MTWGAQEESEGLFYAISASERRGPYPSREEATRAAAEEMLVEALASFPEVRRVGFTEADDDLGSLHLNHVGLRDGYQLHPESDDFEQIQDNPAVSDALAAMTQAGIGTDYVDLLRRT